MAFSTCSHLLLLLLLLPLTLSTPTEYSVTFDTPNPLGLKLDAELRVLGFQRDPQSGERLPAERSLWVREGDVLASVNSVRTAGLSLHSVTLLVAKATLPKRLTFVAPGDREAEMAGVYDGPAGIHGHAGSVELASRAGGVALGSVPFLQAMFGGQLSCAPAPLVLADPPHGCSAYTNTRALYGAIVVVERGRCTFSDKAAIAQGVAAVGLLVLNDASGAYVRMPIDQAEAARLDLTIPAVMVDAGKGAELVRSLLGEGGGGGAGPGRGAAAATSEAKKVLGGVQARLVRQGLACKPWKKKGEGSSGGGGGGGGGKGSKGKGGQGEQHKGQGLQLGDPAAQGGEMLLFAPGTPLSPGPAPAAAAAAAAAAVQLEEPPHRHASGYYSDRAEESGADASAATGSLAARSLEGAAAAARSRWLEEEEEAAAAAAEGGSGELASKEDLAQLAALERMRKGAAVRAEYLRAAFGGPVPQGRLALALAVPFDACSPLQPGSSSSAAAAYAGAAVLVGRGTCGFAVKAAAVRAAGGAAMVVVNNEAGLFAMGGDGGAGAGAVAAAAEADSRVAALVPSVMVTRSTGTALKAALDAAAEAPPPPSLPSAAGHHGSVASAAAAHPELTPAPTLTLLGNGDAFGAWEELGGLLQPSAWSQDSSARRKAYQRLARLHHPDRSTGSPERFQLLAFLYRKANFHYDPASEPGFQNEL